MAGRHNATYSAAVSCQMGRRRANNEDNFYLDGFYKALEQADQPTVRYKRSYGGAVYAVCDGMGGQANGEVAAWIGVDGLSPLLSRFLEEDRPLSRLVDDYVQTANETIMHKSRKAGSQMGATLALAVLLGAEYHIYNLGDSRAYLYDSGALRQLSRDHTEAQSLADMGLPVRPGKDGKLVQFLGIPRDEMILEPYCAEGRLTPEQRLLLCSDGLTDMLSEAEMAAILARETDVQAAVEALTQAAESAGGKDNVTALVVALETE